MAEEAARVRIDPRIGPTHGVHPKANVAPKIRELTGLPGFKAATKLVKSLGYGAGYQYPHDFDGHHVQQTHLPDDLRGSRFYAPSDTGEEKAARERLTALLASRAPGEPGEDG